MSSPLHVETAQHGPVTVARVSGEPDLTNVRDLEHRLWQGIPNSALAVVIDLSGVQYLDSAGLNLLFTLNRSLRKRGQRLALVVPEQALIRPLLHVVQMEAAIEIHASLDGALHTIRAASE